VKNYRIIGNLEAIMMYLFMCAIRLVTFPRFFGVEKDSSAVVQNILRVINH
jgi:hypothetical protein